MIGLKPWIGKKYKSRKNHFSGIRLLVLGESHYRDDPSQVALSQDSGWEPYKNIHGEEQFTIFVLMTWGQVKPFATYTKVANVLLETKGPRNPEKAEIWNHVAFYNYVSIVPWNENQVRPERPTQEQLEESMEPFIEVLNNLEPDAVLMLGTALTNWVSVNHNHNNGECRDLFHPYINNDINYLGIKHPSGGLSYKLANPAFQRLVEQTRHRICSTYCPRH